MKKQSIKLRIINTNALYHMKGKVKLTKEMQAASSKILTNRSSNCSATNSQILFPDKKKKQQQKQQNHI